MTIKLPRDFREIDIKVKGLYSKERCGKADLISYLNELSIVYSEAAKWNEQLGYSAIADDYRSKSKALYEINIGIGAYRK